jgi:hypothetical protein
LYAPKGLTTELLNNINDVSETFSKAMVNQKIEIGNRDFEQEERVLKGNIIYQSLVKLTNLGQQIWDSKSAAKTNDYVIYNTTTGDPDAETVAGTA